MKLKQFNNKKPLSPFVNLFLSPSLQRPQEDSDIDWSIDIPDAPVLLSLHVLPTSEYMLSPHVLSHVLLHNTGSNGKNRAESTTSVLDYSKDQPAIANSWDRVHQVLSIFRTEDSLTKNTEMIYKSVKRIGTYIKHHLVDKGPIKRDFLLVVKNLWRLIDTIYIIKWDLLIFDKEIFLTIKKCIREYIMPTYRNVQLLTSTLNTETNTPVSLPSMAIAPPPTTNTLVVPPPSKTTGPIKKKILKLMTMKKTYTQAFKTKSNILCVKEILQVKKVFPALLANEVGKVLKIKNSSEGSSKPRINMTTRGLSKREVIISMTKVNTELIVNSAHIHISNINNCLKNSKSDINADFV